MIRDRQHGATLPTLPPAVYDDVVRHALARHLRGDDLKHASDIWTEFHQRHARFSFRQLCRRITSSLRRPELTDTLYVTMLQAYFQRRQKLLITEPGLRGIEPEAPTGQGALNDAFVKPGPPPAAAHQVFMRLIQHLLFALESRVPMEQQPGRSIDALLMKSLRRMGGSDEHRRQWFAWLRADTRAVGELPDQTQLRRLLEAIVHEATGLIPRADVETALALAINGVSRMPEARECPVHVLLSDRG